MPQSLPRHGRAGSCRLSGVLTPGGPPIRIVCNVPPGEAARFHFGIFSVHGISGRDVAIASVADLCARRPRFRAGRGRLADHDQRRALPRFHLRRRGQCARPRASASGRGDHRAGAEALARLQPLPHPGRRAAGRRGCARRASPTSCSSPIPAPRRWKARSRWRASISRPPAIPSATASSPSRARSTAARWRRSPPARNKKYLDGFGPVDGRLRPGAVRRSRGGQEGDHGRRPPAILIEPVQGEGGVRVGAARSSCARCASFATSTACC